MALACFALATAAGARAWAGSAPLPAAPFHGLVTLRTDPGPLGPGVVAEVVSAGRHLEVRAFGGSARRLRPRLAGQQLVLAGQAPPADRGHRGMAPVPAHRRRGRRDERQLRR